MGVKIFCLVSSGILDQNNGAQYLCKSVLTKLSHSNVRYLFILPRGGNNSMALYSSAKYCRITAFSVSISLLLNCKTGTVPLEFIFKKSIPVAVCLVFKF